MNAKQKRVLGQQLLDAAADGDLAEVASLIAQGADVNHTATTLGVSVVPLWCDYYQYIIMCSLLV
jgi:hypothetical protein